jgi:hypothetical protein
MYYSYVEIEYVARSFSPARTDLAVKLSRRVLINGCHPHCVVVAIVEVFVAWLLQSLWSFLHGHHDCCGCHCMFIAMGQMGCCSMVVAMGQMGCRCMVSAIVVVIPLLLVVRSQMGLMN